MAPSSRPCARLLALPGLCLGSRTRAVSGGAFHSFRLI